MRWSPRRWWVYFWIATLPIIIIVIFLQPLVIDPLFNKFEPLQNKYAALAGPMEKVIHRAGLDIPRERMFLMYASAKTNQVNAYVTGFGASKRVVVWDTTIQKMTPDETVFIFGHEAGHYVLNHIQQGFCFSRPYLSRLCTSVIADFTGRFRVGVRAGSSMEWRTGQIIDGDALLLQIMVFLCLPIQNGFTRAQEHAADIYGLEVIHGIVPNSEDVAAHSFQVLGEIHLADPESARSDYILALFAPAAGRPAGVCAHLRPMVEGSAAEVRKIAA